MTDVVVSQIADVVITADPTATTLVVVAEQTGVIQIPAQGPQGIQGLAGPVGPAGPIGPAGAPPTTAQFQAAVQPLVGASGGIAPLDADAALSGNLVKATGGVALRSLAARAAAEVMSLAEFIRPTETTWTNAIQRALDHCAANGARVYQMPAGQMMIDPPTTNLVGPNDGTALKILPQHNNFHLRGVPGSTILKPVSNKVEMIAVAGAATSWRARLQDITFDNSDNGLLQGLGNPSWYGSASSALYGGSGVMGNAANCAIRHYAGGSLEIIDVTTIKFQLGLSYLGDIKNKLSTVGDLLVRGLVANGCFCGLLYMTGNSLKFFDSSSRGTVANINPDGSADAGHLLYVADRSAGYPNLIQVSRCMGQDDCSDIIKVRKGVVISISEIIGINCWGGMLVENCEDVVINGINFKIAPTGDSRFGTVKLLEVNDCGTARATNGHFDITGIASGDGYAIYAKQSLTDQTWKNMDIVMSEMTILTDNAQVNDAPVHLENQTRATLRNFQIDNYGTTATGRAAFDIYACANTNIIQPIYRSAAGELNLLRQSQSCTGTYVQYTQAIVNLAGVAPKFIDADGTTTGLVVDAIGGPINARGNFTFANGGTNSITAPVAGSVMLLGADNSLRFAVAAGAVDANGNPVYSITGAAASGTFSIGGGSGAEALRGIVTASSVNRGEARGAVAGSAPSLLANGSDTNIDYKFGGKGTGAVAMQSGVNFKSYTFATLPAASTVNGQTVRVSDKFNRLATSDGTNWRYQDGSVAA